MLAFCDERREFLTYAKTLFVVEFVTFLTNASETSLRVLAAAVRTDTWYFSAFVSICKKNDNEKL